MDNVKTDTVGGNMNFRDKSGNIIATFDAVNRKLNIPSGGLLGLAPITITAGTNLVITGIPTSNPGVAGALWSNSGVLTISAG